MSLPGNTFMNNLNNLNFIISFPLVNKKKYVQGFHFFSQIYIISETNKTNQGSRNAPGSGAASPPVHFLSPDPTALQIRMQSSPYGLLLLKVGHQQECLISALAPSTALTLHYLSDSLVLLLSSYSPIKHSLSPSWLSLEELNSRTSLISPKGSEGRPCHLRSKCGYLPNEEEPTLIFPTFGIFQGARHLRARLPHHWSKVTGPCKEMLWEMPMVSACVPRIVIIDT